MIFSYSINVTEDVGDVILTVYRDQGVVGEVSVVVLITDQGAILGEDFNGTNLEVRVFLFLLHSSVNLCTCSYIQKIVFVSGDLQEDVVINVVDDDLPELNEAFCIRLVLPEGGAVVGEVPEGIVIHGKLQCMCDYVNVCFAVCVTILLNDDAYGQFSFDSSSTSVSIEEAGEIATAANGAVFAILKGGYFTILHSLLSSSSVESDSKWWCDWGGGYTI